MPELPELEVVRDVLGRRVVGQTITGIEIIGSALVLRDLTNAGFAQALTSARIDGVKRRGKFLVFTLADASGRSPIALVGANQRITNFCRMCQPGGLIKGM